MEEEGSQFERSGSKCRKSTVAARSDIALSKQVRTTRLEHAYSSYPLVREEQSAAGVRIAESRHDELASDTGL